MRRRWKRWWLRMRMMRTWSWKSSEPYFTGPAERKGAPGGEGDEEGARDEDKSGWGALLGMCLKSPLPVLVSVDLSPLACAASGPPASPWLRPPDSSVPGAPHLRSPAAPCLHPSPSASLLPITGTARPASTPKDAWAAGEPPGGCDRSGWVADSSHRCRPMVSLRPSRRLDISSPSYISSLRFVRERSRLGIPFAYAAICITLLRSFTPPSVLLLC